MLPDLMLALQLLVQNNICDSMQANMMSVQIYRYIDSMGML